jgi:hypothetical protein
MSAGGTRKVVFLYDAVAGKVTGRMSKDGVDLSDTQWGTQSVTFSAWKNTMKIGADYDANTKAFSGTISDFRIYERAMTDGEVNAYLGI